jgi:hypothetical protein
MKYVTPEECKLLKGHEWLCNLAFLMDILHYLNILNTRLQGKDSLLPLMFNEVNTFMLKLKLFCNNLEEGKLDQFPTLKQHYSDITLDHLKYKAAVKSLYESFIIRFSSFEPERSDIDFFINPLCLSESDLHKYTAPLQMEILEIENHSGLCSKFKELCGSPTTPNSIEFLKYVPKEQLLKLHNIVLRFICTFGFTYICEQTFPSMNAIKSKCCSTITDTHLADMLISSTSTLINS